MKNSRRHATNRYKAAPRFRADAHKTHEKNMKAKPQRGGWRL